jgi:hypothetical protein
VTDDLVIQLPDAIVIQNFVSIIEGAIVGYLLTGFIIGVYLTRKDDNFGGLTTDLLFSIVMAVMWPVLVIDVVELEDRIDRKRQRIHELEKELEDVKEKSDEGENQ